MATALQVDTNLTYCPTSLMVNQPLTITNVSDEELVFKIKTNKKNYLSMNPCNGIIKAKTSLAIPVKIVEPVPENVSIKLEVDWCKVTPQIKQKNDIKMATVKEGDLFKKVFPIIRKDSMSSSVNAPINQSKVSLTTSTFSDVQRTDKEQSSKISPFEYERKEVQEKPKQSPTKLYSSFKEESPKKQELMSDSHKQQYASVNQILDVLSSPNKNLEIVSEEDEQDPEKQLENIRNQQVNERRLIDEIGSKIRKTSKQVKSSEIIEPKLLLLSIAASFLVGSFVQYLIF